ncbi:MAG: AAA family ATPase [Thiomargarita sp.]|nr:AAA family ATPase [Thiomargarita sp.]
MTACIGISGSHRTGKTTLAKVLAEKQNIPFIQTQTSKIFQQYGLNPSQTLDFDKRLWIQNKVLEQSIPLWQNSFITDRTPIDFMAYTLADIQGKTEVNFIALQAYLDRCFDTNNQIFSQLIILQPAIPLIYEEGKAALNQAYIEHLNTIILGLCNDERLKCPSTVIKRHIISIEERILACDY